jgi:hypothetical protein
MLIVLLALLHALAIVLGSSVRLRCDLPGQLVDGVVRVGPMARPHFKKITPRA